MTEKEGAPTVFSEVDFSLEEHNGTPQDQYDMRRVGKKQELNVRFNSGFPGLP